MRKLLLLLALVTLPVHAAEDTESSPNCKLVTQIWWKDGRKKVDVAEIRVTSRDECKAEAKSREVSSWDDANVEKARVTFGFRQPAF